MKTELFKPSHLKELCEQNNLRPSKKYGQNYLVTPTVVEKIIDAGELSSKDTVVEIGPGFGVLTFGLAEKVGNVIAFEIERKLEDYWAKQSEENIEIVWGNALIQFLDRQKSLPEGYKVIANLPYQITSHMLRLLLEATNKPERIIVMVQKEVADRLRAKPGDMSLLTLSAQYYGDVTQVVKVSKGNFWPSPKVDSAVVAISNIRARENAKHFFKVARAGFSSKRKQLWRNLFEQFGMNKEDLQGLVEKVTGNAKIRPQELSVEQWIQLAEKVK
jgi:16S rRNA (adenine1518-N6/adenine1519-N6)-dimethyltransferase